MDRDFLNAVWMDHSDAHISARQPVLCASFFACLVTWSIHNFMLYYTLFSLLAYITSGHFGSPQTWERFLNLSKRYGDRMVGGVWKVAEETALEQSSEIDFGTSKWTIGALGEDDTLENFFEAIPGFLN